MNIDKLDAGFEFISNDELIQKVLNQNHPQENEKNKKEIEEPIQKKKKIIHTEVKSMLFKCLDRFEL